MLLERIEENLKKIESNLDKDNFIYQFLEAYEQPKSSIKRLKDGDYNLSKEQNEVIWKKKIHYYQVQDDEDVHVCIDKLSKSESVIKNKIRFIIVTDFKDFLSVDLNNNSTLDIKILELSKNADFFIPLQGIEKFHSVAESRADKKAAENLGKLYDQIILDNKILKRELNREDINLLFSRLLFLYYSDDSEVFKKDIFLKSLKESTADNGSDLEKYFSKLFELLNVKERDNVPEFLKDFPYVNGFLFKQKIKLPIFTKKTRSMIIANAELDWKNINPDILGSMLQAVVSPEERDEDEMHYTSVSNILKILNPLFLDHINEKVDKFEKDEKELKKILRYIYNLKIFDPACGSGNFLIISYIQLCLIEIKIFKILKKINPNEWNMSITGISISQFYGIEKSHFASETAKLSLWIAEHQMNLKFKEVFGYIKPSLPIQKNENIVNENSANINWLDFCKKEEKTSFIFIVGNPPFKGFSRQNKNKKEDMKKVFKDFKSYKRLDYISLWFYKASSYIKFIQKAECAFVSTNSITQGEHINLFWNKILDSIEIKFAVTSFIWANNAVNNANVSCIIIGLGLKNSSQKIIYDGYQKKFCKKISPYLRPDVKIDVQKKDTPICKDFPTMMGGNMPYDGGHLKFTDEEKLAITNKYPNAEIFFRKLIGGSEFINGLKRWVLWLNDSNLKEAIEIKEIKEKINKVKIYRENAGDVAKSLVSKPHRFRFINEAKKNFIMVPYTSTKDRNYLPVGFINKEYIPLNSAVVIFDPPIFIFSILSSNIHYEWALRLSGKMKNDIRYSSTLCYNTFPIEEIDDQTRQILENISFEILDERENYSDLTISNMYSKNMPGKLKKIHKKNDEIIENILFKKTNLDIEKKIEILLEKYKSITSKEVLL